MKRNSKQTNPPPREMPYGARHQAGAAELTAERLL